MKTNSCVQVLKEHKKEVRCVRMNDEIIVSGSEDETIGTCVTRVKVSIRSTLVVRELTTYFVLL